MQKISVITPSFNQAKYLRQTIESVLSQNYSNVELIVVDGGSKDGSVDIIREYERHLAFWVSESDRGQTHAINKGLSRATGGIVTWLNSDDYYDRDALAAVARAFDESDVGVVYGDYTLVTESGTPFLRRREIRFDYQVLLHGLNYIGQPSSFFRRELLEQHGMLDEQFQYMMDYEYWVRLASRGVPFHHVRKNLSFYRYHEHSKTVSAVQPFLDETYRIRSRYSGVTDVSELKRREFRARFKRQWLKVWQRGTFDYLGGPLRWLAYSLKK